MAAPALRRYHAVGLCLGGQVSAPAHRFSPVTKYRTGAESDAVHESSPLSHWSNHPRTRSLISVTPPTAAGPNSRLPEAVGRTDR